MKALTTITLRGSHKVLRVGSIRSPAALPRMVIRGRAFLSERPDDKRFRYYKGGLAVKFQEVVHSVVAEESEVADFSDSPEDRAVSK